MGPKSAVTPYRMNALQLMRKRIAEASPKQYLHKEITEDLNRSRKRGHLSLIAGILEQLQERVQRTLIEGRNHRLGNVRKEVIDAEARTGEWIYPVGL